MKEGYAITTDGVKFPIRLNRIYGTEQDLDESRIDSIKETGYENLCEIKPNNNPNTLHCAVSLESWSFGPLKLQSIVLPEGVTWFEVSEEVTILDGVELPDTITRLQSYGHNNITINNLEDFLGRKDVDIMFYIVPPSWISDI